jgi:beta-lysine 5,6-aminomutase alpha subunit
MFNFASRLTGQAIHLLGMLTEALHTPFMQDRYLAVSNAKYVMNNMADLGEEIEFRPDGIIVRRAREVLDQAIELLEQVAGAGLFAAIGAGLFADIKRRPNAGKGLEGVVARGDDYWNPVENMLRERLGL